MSKIKAVCFDQGGVLVDIDHNKTITSFEALGATNVKEVYNNLAQAEFINEFEQGKINKKIFRKKMREMLKGLKKNTTKKQIDDAWNAMILGLNVEKFEFIKDLKKQGYKIFMFSNINDIHYDKLLDILKRDGVYDLFNDSFDTLYLSHIFGYSKPSLESFKKVSEDIKKTYHINPDEILFVDDSKQHINGRNGHQNEGATKAGLHTLLVPSNLSANELKDAIMQKIHKINSNSSF